MELWGTQNSRKTLRKEKRRAHSAHSDSMVPPQGQTDRRVRDRQTGKTRTVLAKRQRAWRQLFPERTGRPRGSRRGLEPTEPSGRAPPKSFRLFVRF